MENWLLMQTFYHGLTNSTRETMDAAAGGAFLSLTIAQATALVEKMASNQGWNEERTQTCKRGGCMHQLKEVDMLSAMMDLLMKRLNERAGKKNEVMHIHDSRMTCEEWRNWAFRQQLPRATRGCELPQQQQLLSPSTKSRLEPTAKA
jgi:hypothetical protein